ncbi:VC2046/SO_2500 family protein [Ferrimonas balearica]|uniref:VC2046/SO_2500 family protein n=1 Tax=Ferrimonas balearica TaxID=44012 RepID=UPI001C99D281|nr:VC2046/SO_2500 family protein [Ferrimonas balearica]MBY5991905.1 hypothetical protein [Ferrimonas balearica]
MRPEGILVNEWQLGNALNQAVHQDRRGDFGLLLSMMVQDVRYHGSFELLKDEDQQPLPLRRRFDLPEAAPLSGEYRDSGRAAACAAAFHQGGLLQSRLQHCLQPEPLDNRGAHPHGLALAIANAEPVARPEKDTALARRRLRPTVALSDLIAEQRLQSQALQAVA